MLNQVTGAVACSWALRTFQLRLEDYCPVRRRWTGRGRNTRNRSQSFGKQLNAPPESALQEEEERRTLGVVSSVRREVLCDDWHKLN